MWQEVTVAPSNHTENAGKDFVFVDPERSLSAFNTEKFPDP